MFKARRAKKIEGDDGARRERAVIAVGDDVHKGRPEITSAVTRGVMRLFVDLGLSPLCEAPLGNGRRADIVALDARGRIHLAEVKSSREDFAADGKWMAYLGYCDRFYFAVAEAFPRAVLPQREGLIVADRFGGAILRQGPDYALPPARRKAVTLRFARLAAERALRR